MVTSTLEFYPLDGWFSLELSYTLTWKKRIALNWEEVVLTWEGVPSVWKEML
jgi:hypothetical protein